MSPLRIGAESYSVHVKDITTTGPPPQEGVERHPTLAELVRPTANFRDLAKEAGVSYSLVTKVSTGERKPNEAIKRAVERLFKVPASLIWPEDD
jgi:hypothetical protein